MQELFVPVCAELTDISDNTVNYKRQYGDYGMCDRTFSSSSPCFPLVLESCLVSATFTPPYPLGCLKARQMIMAVLANFLAA